MNSFLEFILQHAHKAHWFIFGAALLAGMNVPFSIDVLLILSAVLAATVVPEHTLHLFLAVLLGCYFSAWIAYWIGRMLGPKLFKIRWFAALLTHKRMQKMKKFHERFGLWTLLIGRFIPFGVRNCIFMTSGISQMPFKQFIRRDALACTVWCSTCFSLCYYLGQHYKALIQGLKAANVLIFGALVMTVIAALWYNRRKKKLLCSNNLKSREFVKVDALDLGQALAGDEAVPVDSQTRRSRVPKTGLPAQRKTERPCSD